MQAPARLGIRQRETGYFRVTPWIGGPWPGSRRRLPHRQPTLPRARASPTREHLPLPTRSRPRRSRRRSARRKPARPQPPMKRPRVSLDLWSRPSSPPPTTPFAFVSHTLKTLGTQRKLFLNLTFAALIECRISSIQARLEKCSTLDAKNPDLSSLLWFRLSDSGEVRRRVGL